MASEADSYRLVFHPRAGQRPTPQDSLRPRISEAARVPAAPGGLPPGHGLVVIRDLRWAERVVVNRNLRDGSVEPRVVGHGPDVQRAAVGPRRHSILAHAAGRIMHGLVPFHAVDPDIERARPGRNVRTVRRLVEGGIFADHVNPLAWLQQATYRLPVRSGAESGGRVERV